LPSFLVVPSLRVLSGVSRASNFATWRRGERNDRAEKKKGLAVRVRYP
jgi:hypothetical protein